MKVRDRNFDKITSNKTKFNSNIAERNAAEKFKSFDDVYNLLNVSLQTKRYNYAICESKKSLSENRTFYDKNDIKRYPKIKYIEIKQNAYVFSEFSVQNCVILKYS